MHPWPGFKGTAERLGIERQTPGRADITVERTPVESAADGGDDELNCPKSTHPGQDGAVLIENGVDPDNMGS